MSETVAEIKERLKNGPVSQDVLDELKKDERKAVIAAVTSYEKKVAKEQEKQDAFFKRTEFERDLTAKGYLAIAGIDEVGRGPLAGPVVACAVILPHDFHEVEVNDSKQVSEKKRTELFQKIMYQAVSVGIGVMDQDVIDRVNIYQATRLAMNQAVENLSIPADYLLLDAMKLDLAQPQVSLIKGDARSVSIAAASIVAKVTRDTMMADFAKIYPGYGFDHNAGYGTAEHLAGLAKFGVTPIHRRTFAPVKDYL